MNRQLTPPEQEFLRSVNLMLPDDPRLKPDRDFLASQGFAWQLDGNKRWFAGGIAEGRTARKRVYFGAGGWIPCCGSWEGPRLPTSAAALLYAELTNWGN